MSLPRSRHFVSNLTIGRQAWCCATVHGTVNLALPDVDFIDEWYGYFDLAQQPKPRYIVKVDDASEARVLATGAQLKRAQDIGGLGVFQIRDGAGGSSPSSRGLDAAISQSLQASDIAAENGVIPDEFCYGNEMDDEWSALTVDEAVRLVLGVYERLGSRFPTYGLGQVASWGDGIKWAAAFIRHRKDFERRRFGSFTVHQYRGQPWIPFKLGVADVVGLLCNILGTRLSNDESDLSFTPGGISFGIHDYRGAVYAVMNNLEHAAREIPCADFTLHNGVGVGLGGNGLFKEDSTAHPSGAAMRDIVAPFTKYPLLQANRQTWDDVSVFANANQELVVCRFSETPNQTADIAFRQSMYGQRADWANAANLTAFLGGAAPPQAPDEVTAPDWEELREIHAQATADLVAGYKDIEIRLPLRASSVAILEEYNDGSNAAQVMTTDYGIKVRLYNKAMVYLRVD